MERAPTSSIMEDEYGCERTDRLYNIRQDVPVELVVNMAQLLLPFTHGIDALALDYACALAERLHATLVGLSLIRLPEAAGTHNPRLEAIEQSQDFLAFAHLKATRQGVPFVRMELYTYHPVRSICALACELECKGILLFIQRGEGVLLATEEVKQLLEQERVPLYIVPLLPRENDFPRPRWLSRWLNR